MKRVRLYEVTMQFGERSYARPVSAFSPAAAKYRAYLDADLGISFKEYQKNASARLYPGELIDDGYNYIRSTYGINPRIGQRATLTKEGSDCEGVGGEIVYPGTSRRYVHILLDGLSTPAMVHPHSIVLSSAPELEPT